MTKSGFRLRPGRSSFAVLAALSLVASSRAARAETLTVEEAVSRAAERNPSLRAALLDAAAARESLEAERGARAPTLVAGAQAERSERVSRPGASGVAANVDGATSRVVQNAVTTNAAVRYRSPIGTELELGTAAGTTWSRTRWSGLDPLPDNLSLGPTYSAEAYVSARQPLLRGAGRDAELAALSQAAASARGAAARHTLASSQTALDVLDAYWQLWYAERAVLVQEQAATIAERLVQDARVRATTLGTGSEVDVLQFTTQAASIADALSQARAERETRAIELGRILGMEPAAARALRASDDPPELGPAPALDTIVREVAEASPALAALRADLERARTRLAVARDADQPRLDLFATGSVGTLWDDRSDFSLTGGRPTFGVIAGLELELPLGSGRYAADAAAAQHELAAAEARYEAELAAIRARLSSLGVSASAARDQVQLATETASAAGRLAEAERQRLALGTTTARDVVSAEQTSRETELRRLRALVTQASARLALEHDAGTLLQRFAAL